MAAGTVYSYPKTILEQHLDTFGHVNNAAYFVLLEEARWDFMTKHGFGLEEIRASGTGPTLLEIKIRFLKELKLRDEISIESVTTSYNRQIFKVEQKIFRAGELCCVAEFTGGLFDINKRKLIAPTPAWLKALGVEATN